MKWKSKSKYQIVLFFVITLSHVISMIYRYNNKVIASTYFSIIAFFLLIIYQFNNRWIFGMCMGITLLSVALLLGIFSNRKKNKIVREKPRYRDLVLVDF